MLYHKAKYVILELSGIDQPIVFNEIIDHSYVARQLGRRDNDQIISAGFCHVGEDGRYRCYGESIGLKLKSRGEQDEAILNQMLAMRPAEDDS